MPTHEGVDLENDLGVEMHPVADDFISPVPQGLQTVPGWWAERETEALELLYDPVETFVSHADKLETLAKQRDMPIAWVEAPTILQRAKRFGARAFPRQLLASFYSRNP